MNAARHRRRAPAYAALALALAGGLSACSGTPALRPAVPLTPPIGVLGRGKIRHVVLIVQENRTFDDLFGGFQGGPAPYPGADARIPRGLVLASSTFATKAPYNTHDWFRCLQVHRFSDAVWHDYAEGVWPSRPIPCPTTAPPANPDVPPHVGPEPQTLTIVDTRHRSTYWAIAREFELGDRFFAVQSSDSFPGHQYVVALASRNDRKQIISGTPTLPNHNDLASCGVAVRGKSVQTPVLDPATGFTRWQFEGRSGVCWGGATFGDALDRAHVTWRHYSTDPNSGVFDGFINFRRWYPQTKVVASGHFRVSLADLHADVVAGRLPQFAWVKPPCIPLSDHPGTHQDHYGGQDWVADVVNWIGTSKAWKSTVIFVVWDDWGGFYDHVIPPASPTSGITPGMREPFLVISPWDRTSGGVIHSVGTYASVVKFVEDLYGVAPLNALDAGAPSLGAYFDFSKKVLPEFVTIPFAESGFDPQKACAAFAGTPLSEIDR